MRLYLILLFFFVCFLLSAQPDARKFDGVYFSASIDPNNLFNIVDNPRISTDVKGANYRLELGAMNEYFSGGLFFEDFPAIGYYTYGMGLSGLFTPSDDIFLTAGLNYGFLHRDYLDGHYLSLGVQFKAGYALTRHLFVVADLEFKQRNDLAKNKFIAQGKIGLRYIFLKNWSRSARRFK